jgi:hypothetical protein
MSALKQLWTKISQFVIALEDARDPMEEYVRTLGRRVEKLERDVERLEVQPHSRPGGGGI